MDEFGFVLALIALLLGLALTEMARGLASAVKARRRLSLGWLTPLAALLISLDIATLWANLWAWREIMDADSLTLIVATLLCLGYYLAASFVFPDTMTEGMSLDDWFMANRRFSLGGTLALSFVFSIIQHVAGVKPVPPLDIIVIAERYWGWLLYVVIHLLFLFSSNRKLILAAMTFNLAMYGIIFGLLR